MNNNDNYKSEVIMYALGSIVIIWLGIAVAPYIDGGIPNIISNFSEIMDNPFKLMWCENSLKTILIFLLIILLILFLLFHQYNI